MHRYRKGGVEVAGVFRKSPTKTEKFVWRWLRNRRFGDWKFRRRYPIEKYIVDFYCDELKLIVEIDGAAHTHSGRHDEKRDRYLRSMGLDIVRISSDRVLKDQDGVVDTILLAILRRLPLTRRFAAPSPQGEG